MGNHEYHVERETLRDAAVCAFEAHVEKLQIHSDYTEVEEVLSSFERRVVMDMENVQLPQGEGFSLKTFRKRTSFLPKQREYLIALFDRGAQEKLKCDPKTAAIEMQKDPNFTPEEFLTTTQIASFWANEKRKRLQQIDREKRSVEDEGEEEEVSDNGDTAVLGSDEAWDDEYLDWLEMFPDLEDELMDHLKNSDCMIPES